MSSIGEPFLIVLCVAVHFLHLYVPCTFVTPVCTCIVVTPVCTCIVVTPVCTCIVVTPACTCIVVSPACTCIVVTPACTQYSHYHCSGSEAASTGLSLCVCVVFQCDLVYTFFHPLLRDEQETFSDQHLLCLPKLRGKRPVNDFP